MKWIVFRFVDLTKAFEILSDPTKKLNYDNYGITEDAPNFNKRHDYAQYNRFLSINSLLSSTFKVLTETTNYVIRGV